MGESRAVLESVIALFIILSHLFLPEPFLPEHPWSLPILCCPGAPVSSPVCSSERMMSAFQTPFLSSLRDLPEPVSSQAQRLLGPKDRECQVVGDVEVEVA